MKKNGYIRVFRIVFFFLFAFSLVLSVLPVLGQEQGTTAPTPVNKKQKKADKKKEKQKVSSQKIIDDGIKRHNKIQTKEVQKRMKESRKKADRNNHNRREPFYKRWFRKENRTKKWYQIWRKK